MNTSIAWSSPDFEWKNSGPPSCCHFISATKPTPEQKKTFERAVEIVNELSGTTASSVGLRHGRAVGCIGYPLDNSMSCSSWFPHYEAHVTANGAPVGSIISGSQGVRKDVVKKSHDHYEN